MSKIDEFIEINMPRFVTKGMTPKAKKELDQLRPYVELAELFAKYIDYYDTTRTAMYALSKEDEGRAIELVKLIKKQNNDER